MNILNTGNLNIPTNCEECENSFALIYCQHCEQYMCEKCDLKIHNKGKRAQHSRRHIQNEYSFSINDQSTQKFAFQTQQVFESETLQSTLPQAAHQLLQYMKTQCYQGQIVYTQEQLQQLFQELKINMQIISQYVKNSRTAGSQLIQKCVDRQQLLKTTRLFNGNLENFYSLNLQDITYESLCWVILSIKKDLITPTERLVLSRIKECFGIKLCKNDWDTILHVIRHTKSPIRFKTSQGRYIELPYLCVRTIRDPLINEQTVGIYILDQQWIVEDSLEGNQGIEQRPEWTQFLEFLNQFFSKLEEENHKSRILTGGRYGCAQYSKYEIHIFLIKVKLFGPKVLRECSLGRLTLFVQMAVNKGFIKYNKTILIKNKQDYLHEIKDSNNVTSQFSILHQVDSSLEQDTKIKLKIQSIQQALIEVLLENPDGISLAQIPQFLKARLNFDLDFNELGFPKLKNFIESMKGMILLNNYGKNNCVASIVPSKIPLAFLESQKEKRKEVKSAMKPQASQVKQEQFGAYMSDRTHYKQQIYPQNNNQIQNQSTPDGSNKQDKLLMNILKKIEQILRGNQYGISLSNLYHSLSNNLTGCFAYQQFGCHSFLQFLQNYADSSIVIVCQKDDHWIYERDYMFKPPPPSDGDLLSQSMNSQYSWALNDNQFEQVLNEAFPNQFGLPIQSPSRYSTQQNLFLDSKSSNVSWLEKPEQYSNPFHIRNSQVGLQIPMNQNQSRILPQKFTTAQLPEDSNLDIRENLRFIEELLGDHTDTEVTQLQDQYEWSVSTNQQIGMISSINLGAEKLMHSKNRAYSEDFDLTKALEEKERRFTQGEKSVKKQ